MKHDDVGGAFLDKKLYKEIVDTIRCDCKDMTERCLRCRVLDVMRSNADSMSYMDSSNATICSEKAHLQNDINKHGDDKLIKIMEERKAEHKKMWEDTKKKRGWK